jgi:hypothetical protein
MAEKVKARLVSFAYDSPLSLARLWGLYVSAGHGEEPAFFNEPGVFLVRPDGTLYYGSTQTMPFATAVCGPARHRRLRQREGRSRAGRIRRRGLSHVRIRIPRCRPRRRAADPNCPTCGRAEQPEMPSRAASSSTNAQAAKRCCARPKTVETISNGSLHYPKFEKTRSDKSAWAPKLAPVSAAIPTTNFPETFE